MRTINQDRPDPFALSLRGLRSLAAFAQAPAVAHDRLNRAIARRLVAGKHRPKTELVRP